MLTDDVDRRVDRVVRRLLPQVPLSRLYQALREGDIRVNGARVGPATRTREADLIWVAPALAASGGAARRSDGRRIGARIVPCPQAGSGPQAGSCPQAGSGSGPALSVLYRDADILVVDKPAGLAVHGGGDSVMARLAECVRPARPALSFTPAPVHQLDRVTSGALVVALTLAAARSWSAALRSGTVIKLYLAAVAGDVRTPAGGALWEDRLRYDRRARRARTDPAGAHARARVWSVARTAGAAPTGRAATLLLVRLHTGRRHQIRAQAAARGHALLGDRRYATAAVAGRRRQSRLRGPAHRSAPGAGWPLLHAAAVASDAPAHAAVMAPLPDAARAAIGRHFGPAAERRAAAAVARRLAGRQHAAAAPGNGGEPEHG